MKHRDLLLDKKEPMNCANKHGSKSKLVSRPKLHNKEKMIEQQTFEAFKSHINQYINVNVLNLLSQ